LISSAEEGIEQEEEEEVEVEVEVEVDAEAEAELALVDKSECVYGSEVTGSLDASDEHEGRRSDRSLVGEARDCEEPDWDESACTNECGGEAESLWFSALFSLSKDHSSSSTTIGACTHRKVDDREEG
jgi:hypothetical protein